MTREDILKAAQDCTPQQAYDEAMRELEVRSRCYPKWTKEGKISYTEATERFKQQAGIVALLADFPGVTSNVKESSTEWKPF